MKTLGIHIQGNGHDVEVPGALEIPGAITQAELTDAGYDGYIALGCVIRGETTHYDYVCGESARGLMDLSREGVPVGNGILTVENRAQAMVRAVDKNKGADAAEAEPDGEEGLEPVGGERAADQRQHGTLEHGKGAAEAQLLAHRRPWQQPTVLWAAARWLSVGPARQRWWRLRRSRRLPPRPTSPGSP
mgnify:CR=1 FL=1